MEAILVTLVVVGIGIVFAVPPLLVTLNRKVLLSLSASAGIAFVLWALPTAFLLAWSSRSPDYKLTLYFVAGMYFIPSLFWLLMAWLWNALSNSNREI